MINQNNILFSRIQGIFETKILKDKTVTIIGLGSIGSFAATALTQCGICHFTLIDYDVLQLHNIARHACGIRDVGILKIEAVKNLILNTNPEAEIITFNTDILRDQATLQQAIRSADLVLACTDSERSKYRINSFCIHLWEKEKISVPVIYAGAYERAFGGDVIRVIPGDTPCYDCILGEVHDLSEYESKPKKTIAYTNIDNSGDFKAEPGLGLDVHFIALIQAKIGLLTLLKGTESKLEDITYNYLIWSNRKEWFFDEPFRCYYANVKKRENCPTCGSGIDLLDKYGIDHENIDQEAKDLLNSLRKSDFDISKIYSS